MMGYGYGMMRNYGGYQSFPMEGIFGGVFQMILGLLLVALIVTLVFYLFKRKDKDDSLLSFRKEKTSLEILKERYAQGELAVEQYYEMKKILES